MAVEIIVPAVLAILRLAAVHAAWVGSVVGPTMGGGLHGGGGLLHGGLHGGGLHGAGLHGAGNGGMSHAQYRADDQVGSGVPGPTVAYPYYTTRGPRDFLLDNPPSIGR